MVRFSPPTPSCTSSTALMPPHLLTALRRCPVPYETLLRHPRRVVSTYDELKLAIHGLSSPCPPSARLIWNFVVAVHVSTFCTYRHYHYVIAGISLLYATLIQLAEAPLPGRPVNIDAPRTPVLKRYPEPMAHGPEAC